MRKYFWMLMVYSMGSNAQWEQVVDMAAEGSEQSDFGINMLFTEDHLIVSWPRTYVQGGPPTECGEVITYQKNGAEFEEINRINAADLVGDCVPGDGFGYGLAYDGGRLAIGMPAGARAGSNLPGGATDADSRVFITTMVNGEWQLQETLIADDLGSGKGMGFQMVMEDDLLLVHAHEYDSIFGVAFPVSTGVYVFKDSGSGFVQQQKLEENFHLFGQDFDTENGQIVVGAWGEQTIGAAGRIYVYEEQGGSWELVQTINDSRSKNLGNQIEIYQDTMVAGSVNAGGTGAVVVYEKTQSGWQEIQFIEASDKAMNDQFGLTVRLDEDDLVVGATAGTNQVQTVGAAYHFTREGSGDYIEQQKIESPNQNEAADQFGANLIFNDTDLLVNEPSGRNLQGGITNFWHFSREGGAVVTPTADINQKSSGVWQVAGVSGQSVNLEILDDQTALMYLNYANANGSSWYFSVGQINDDSITFNEVLATDGPNFGANFSSNDLNISTAGQASFNLHSCESATFELQLGNQAAQQFSLDKSIGISDLGCDTSNKVLENGVSGSWFNPQRSGEGFSIYTHGPDSNQTASVYWYTYDTAGNAIIFTGQGSVSGSTINISELRQYGSAQLFSSSASFTVVGSLSLDWDGQCGDASMDYQMADANYGSGSIVLSQLARVKDSNCQ